MDAYGPPSNFLEIDVGDHQIIGVGRNRYTSYRVRMKVSVPKHTVVALALVAKLSCCAFASHLACLAAKVVRVKAVMLGALSPSRWRFSKTREPGVVSGLVWGFTEVSA